MPDAPAIRANAPGMVERIWKGETVYSNVPLNCCPLCGWEHEEGGECPAEQFFADNPDEDFVDVRDGQAIIAARDLYLPPEGKRQLAQVFRLAGSHDRRKQKRARRLARRLKGGSDADAS